MNFREYIKTVNIGLGIVFRELWNGLNMKYYHVTYIVCEKATGMFSKHFNQVQ